MSEKLDCLCLTKNQLAPDMSDEEWEHFLEECEAMIRAKAKEKREGGS